MSENKDRLALILGWIDRQDGVELFWFCLIMGMPLLFGVGWLFTHIFDKLMDHGWSALILLTIGATIGYFAKHILSYAAKEEKKD